MAERTRVLVLSSGSGLDIAGELGAVLGPGFEVSLVRAANRQTVELVLDGAVQFGIVHILAHGSTLGAGLWRRTDERSRACESDQCAEGSPIRRFGLLQRVRDRGRDPQRAARAGRRLQCADRRSSGGRVCARLLPVLAAGSGRKSGGGSGPRGVGGVVSV